MPHNGCVCERICEKRFGELVFVTCIYVYICANVRTFLCLCGSAYQFITFHGFGMTLRAAKEKEKLESNPSSGEERGVTSSHNSKRRIYCITHFERLQIHQRTFRQI